MKLSVFTFDSPLGEMFGAVDRDGALVSLLFVGSRDPRRLAATLPGETAPDDNLGAEVKRQVAQYFRGERREFDLALNPSGTEFQRRVWEAVRRITYGRTESYGEVAARLDRPGASRAVGRANATNPVCLVVPCHRVIGSNGALTGYGGGMERKRSLLELEAAHAGARPGSQRALTF